MRRPWIEQNWAVEPVVAIFSLYKPEYFHSLSEL